MAKQAQSHGPKGLLLEFGDRKVRVRHADESVLSRMECPSCGPSHGFVVIGFATDRSAAKGLYVSLSAASAREYGGLLIDLANEIDSGRSLQ